MMYLDTYMFLMFFDEALGDRNFINFYNEFTREVDEMIFDHEVIYLPVSEEEYVGF